MTALVEAASLPETAGGKWIGRDIAPLEIVAILFVGSVGILIAGLQPQLLGALAAEHRLTATELGWAATAELLTIGLAAGIAGGVLKPVGLRSWAAGASLALMAIDILMRGESHLPVVAIRAAAGVAEGILLWIPVSMIARSTTPGRWSGIFLAVQTLAQFVYSEILPATAMAKLGATGGFYALAGTSLVCAGVALLLPQSFDPLPHESGDQLAGALSLRAFAALASVFLFMAFIVGFWSYFEPISAEAHHPDYVYNQAASLSLFAQVTGAFLASFVAGRVSFFPVILVCTIVNLAILAVVATMPGPALFIALAGVFGFLWLFLMPFQVPMVIEADPTRRAAVLMPGAQLMGAALGPMLCSFAVVGADVRGVLAVCAVSLVLAFVVAGWLHWRKHGLPVSPLSA
ncbi:MAG TPA: MFS transporter [Rhizomicrobium sp.]|nr:MFS transporter [Rhizomicrobium sp.]